MKLLLQGIVKYAVGLVFVGLLLFLPAGSISFFNGWLFLGVFFLPILILGIVLFFKSPDLLRRRLDGKEMASTQKVVLAISAIAFLAGFLLCGFDYRFGWSHVPAWCVGTACVLFLGSYLLYAEVMRENAYLSRTVKVEAGQKVVDTGLYGIVRHPMYTATILMFTVIPVILGSWYGILAFLPYPVVILLRIRNEEALLEKELEGYAEYKKRVKYRLIPFVW